MSLLTELPPVTSGSRYARIDCYLLQAIIARSTSAGSALWSRADLAGKDLAPGRAS
jgi:hypothetical protein